MSVNHITSDYLLDDIEHHFRVSAGPGAGKTHWLVEHIKNVLYNSDRLAKTRKIACITYTNIAVETILGRLGTSADRVEVSTIHSFLYKNILKPYAPLIASDFGLNVEEIDGHDEHFASIKKMVSWVEAHPNVRQLKHPYSVNQLTRLENNKKALLNWLGSLTYKLDNQGVIEIISDRSKAYYFDVKRMQLNRNCLNVLESDFLNYKKLYWSEGKISHDDVLFLSYQIIKKFPFVLEVLRAKFPYFFVDEFQDSNPIQVEILKLIGEKETVIGIIGDKAQSIYGFQGAMPSQFHTFNLGHVIDYVMSDNRRSSNEIIEILNFLRGDITQNSFRNESSMQPTILVGEMSLALQYAKSICKNENVTSLSRQNITSNAMKIEIGGVSLNGKLFNDLSDKDSNRDRRVLITACIKAVEFAREKKFKDSIKELEKIYRYKNDKQKGKRKALMQITTLLEKYDEFKNGSLYDFSVFVKREINPEIAKVSGGAIRPFYDGHTYLQIALCVSITEDMSLHKTIHKSKGDEFDNVLLVLKKEIDLSFILAPNINDDTNAAEEQRVNYVAVSRARNRLFISVPTLSAVNEEFLKTKFTMVIL
ncbi:UvrD-helicase domain-containing protein [Flavobacterium sp. PL002]|uniref:UvrD-helicase domain-containing protein n=1 Tax=Flavobacterium sp. PL002 TaxID=1897058 RepID=UPI0017880323|nr:ATP-dependent helicase [Flavobacterium sp. PL002]MBE0392462.1 ATP-dependent DNA helicase PcrA [Flavobacterium sp. PL002]